MPDSTLSAGGREYAALTSGVGAVVLDGWTTVRVRGADRATFLHNMCTADVRALAAGQGGEAFFTDVKGKIVAHAFMLAGETEHLLLGVPQQAERLIAHLDRYIIREDVQLSDGTADTAWTLVVGPQSAATIGGGGSDADLTKQFSASWAHCEFKLDGLAVRLVRCDLPWPGGYLVACPAAGAGELRGRLASGGAVSATEGAWQALRIESGWPLLGVDFDGANLPQEVGRDAAAISFRKGCYLGQETVARIDALGHVNKQLATVRLAGDQPPAVGAAVEAEGQLVGRITSAYWSPRLSAPLALAMLRRGHNEPGARLTCDGQGAEVIATPAVQG